MARIIIKGEKDPILVSNAKGMMLKEFYENPNVLDTQKVSIENWSGTKADIKGIWIDKQEIVKKAVIDYGAEYRKERELFFTLTPDQKSGYLAFFKMVYMQFAGKYPDETTLEKAKKLQKEFFEKNPLRRIPDTTIFSKLLPTVKGSKGVLGNAIKSIINQDYRNQNSW